MPSHSPLRHAALRIVPWALGTFLAAGALPIYLMASTRPELEAYSESPGAWTFAVLVALLVVVALTAMTWSRAAWKPLRGVLLSGAIAGSIGATAYGTYVYWFSSATLAAGEAAPRIGSQAPDFEIIDPEGRVRSLDGYAGKTLLLVFYRGHW